MPSSGWINDPNGPFYHNGRYHLFYQHIINGCEWDFGIVWGHAVTTDLVHWEHLPPALMPTPGGLDADGCFSGCCIIDTDGTPTILYTGVRLRSNPDCGPLPPPEHDLNLPFVESQCYAVPELGYDGEPDPLLANWVKSEEPFLAYPPPDSNLVGWRDPFIFEFKGKDGQFKEWGMLMGSGIKGKGGSIMVYRSDNLRSGWRYDGTLCEADSVDTGAMWECPLLLALTVVPEEHRRRSALGSLRSLSNSYNNISAFHPSSNGSHPASPTADRKSAAAAGPQVQAGFSPRKDMAAGTRATGRGGTEDGKEPPPGGGAGGEGAGKSLLSEQLLNPYADEAGTMEDGNLSLEAAGEAQSNGEVGSSRQEEGQGEPQYTHFLCVSPDAPTNPVLYWLGNFDAQNTRFLLEGAMGPLRLDLGDTLYAPNLLEDHQGRHVLWGWLQERRKVGSYDYAGCLSLPRIMYISGNRLIQEPAPEVNRLRQGECWRTSHLQIFPEEATPLEGVAGPALDIVISLERGTATAAGVLLRSWNAGGEGSAAILLDWERNVLEAIFEGGVGRDLATTTDLDPDSDGQRRVGGPVNLRPGEPLTMRVLVDHSCVEVYLSSGEVLSTRVYRGHPPHGSDAGIDFVAYGGIARAERVEAWEMGSIWQREYSREPEKSGSYSSMYEPINTVMPVGSPVAV
ncbi:hypothetical protein WJX75_001798 [Coccomyxa subellipsoidea]|uniref:beta-fructofuranosidase n=1 Tax=Coccomyxa subellipsoidea TaxID=248742 RepID=A0ABR2YXF6_9CHLO